MKCKCSVFVARLTCGFHGVFRFQRSASPSMTIKSPEQFFAIRELCGIFRSEDETFEYIYTFIFHGKAMLTTSLTSRKTAFFLMRINVVAIGGC